MPLPRHFNIVNTLLDKAITSTFTNAHAVDGHVRAAHPPTPASKSYFVSAAGDPVNVLGALDLCLKAKTEAMKALRRQRVTHESVRVERINADSGKIGVAITWGETTGISRRANCEWVVIVFIKQLASRPGGQYSKIATTYPATASYVNGKIFTPPPAPVRRPAPVRASVWGT